MNYRYGLTSVLCLLLAGCNTMTVQEAVLSTNQRIAMVSTPGDGVSPPTNVVLLEQAPGVYSPVSTGFGTAPIPALLTGGVAGIAVGAGLGLGGDRIAQNCGAVNGGSTGAAFADGGAAGTGGAGAAGGAGGPGGNIAMAASTGIGLSTSAGAGGAGGNGGAANGGAGGAATTAITTIGCQ